MASSTSIALPTVRPRGWFMSVSTARVITPAPRPTRQSMSASADALSCVFMNAPEPHFTSRTSSSIPSANFFERMLAVISGMDGTVLVSFLVEDAVGWRQLTRLTRDEAANIRERLPQCGCIRSVRYPGIASSLSSVPPVCPSPRPLIMGTREPKLSPQRCQHQRHLIAHPTGGVLVDKRAIHVCPVELVARLDHRHRQRHRLFNGHSLVEDERQERSSLWPCHPTIDDAIDEFTNLSVAEGAPFSLCFEDLVNHSVGARTLSAGDDGHTR